MGGDVTGPSNACTVVGFGTYPIDLVAPAVGDAWQWDGAQWAHVQQPIVFLVPTVPSTTITSNRSANQSPTAAALVGSTNLGSDTTGLSLGVTASWATVVGGDACEATDDYASAFGGIGNAAGGFASVTVGGEANVIDFGAEYASTLGGSGNSITGGGLYASAIGGSSNTASSSRAVVLGGSNNTASAASSAVLGGQRNTASASFAVAHGIGAEARLSTSSAHAGGQTEAAGVGNRQWMRAVLRGDTAGAAPAETVNLGTGGYGVSPTTTAFAMLDDRAYLVTVRAAGVRATGAGRSLEVHAFVRRLAGVVDVVAQHVALSVGDPACCLYDVELLASGGNLLVQATTGAGNTHATRWVGSVEWEEVRFA